MDYATLNDAKLAARWLAAFTDGPVVSGPWTLAPGTRMAVRREVFDEIGCFDATIRRGEDGEFFVRVLRDGIGYAEVVEPLPKSSLTNLSSVAREGGRQLVAKPSGRTIALLSTAAAFATGRQFGRLRRNVRRSGRA
jgi:hypothetical protein